MSRPGDFVSAAAQLAGDRQGGIDMAGERRNGDQDLGHESGLLRSERARHDVGDVADTQGSRLVESSCREPADEVDPGAEVLLQPGSDRDKLDALELQVLVEARVRPDVEFPYPILRHRFANNRGNLSYDCRIEIGSHVPSPFYAMSHCA